MGGLSEDAICSWPGGYDSAVIWARWWLLPSSSGGAPADGGIWAVGCYRAFGFLSGTSCAPCVYGGCCVQPKDVEGFIGGPLCSHASSGDRYGCEISLFRRGSWGGSVWWYPAAGLSCSSGVLRGGATWQQGFGGSINAISHHRPHWDGSYGGEAQLLRRGSRGQWVWRWWRPGTEGHPGWGCFFGWIHALYLCVKGVGRGSCCGQHLCCCSACHCGGPSWGGWGPGQCQRRSSPFSVGPWGGICIRGGGIGSFRGVSHFLFFWWPARGSTSSGV